MYALEELFPERPMLPPPGSARAAKARELMDLERSLFSTWFGWLRSGQDGSGRFSAAMQRVCAELSASGGPYFLGEEVSMVDLMFLPFAERIAASLPYYKGLDVRGRKEWAPFDRWLTALETETDWYPGIKVRARRGPAPRHPRLAAALGRARPAVLTSLAPPPRPAARRAAV